MFPTILIVFFLTAVPGVDSSRFLRCKYVLYPESKQHLIITNKTQVSTFKMTHIFTLHLNLSSLAHAAISGKKHTTKYNYAIGFISQNVVYKLRF